MCDFTRIVQALQAWCMLGEVLEWTVVSNVNVLSPMSAKEDEQQNGGKFGFNWGPPHF
jgi:hypothetical protein